MLKDKNRLEEFDLVKELDNQAAETMCGGNFNYLIPFFTRYLEGLDYKELSKKENEDDGGDKIAVTLKYPSDQDEAVWKI